MAATTRDDASIRHSHRAFAQQTRILDELRALQGVVDVVHPSPARHQNSVRGVEGSDHQLRQERLGMVGELTAEFCHQIRTPLASLSLYAEQLDKNSPQAIRIAEGITRGINDIRRLANDMLGFAAGGRESRTTLRIADLFSDVERAYRASRTEASQLRIYVGDDSLTIDANRAALQGAILNLINNARQSGNRTTSILLHAERFDDVIHICVTDDGPGIPDNLQGRLFEPFFTTRPQGTGLGLSIVDTVAKEHGGDVSFTSSRLGSSFTVRIPCTDNRKATL